MILTLSWLTISLPFVTKTQKQVVVKTTSKSDNSEKKDNSSNPFANTTEEKNPGGNTFVEEYLHESYHEPEFLLTPVTYDKCTHPAIYVSFHGELLSPPPEAC